MRQATESSVGPCTHHCSLIYMKKTSKQIPAKSHKSPVVLSIKVLLCSLSKFWPGGFVHAGFRGDLGRCSRSRDWRNSQAQARWSLRDTSCWKHNMLLKSL